MSTAHFNSVGSIRVFFLIIITAFLGTVAVSLGNRQSTKEEHQMTPPSIQEKTDSSVHSPGVLSVPGWKQDQIVSPEELVKWTARTDKPLMLYVGPPSLYRRAHIPGAKMVGRGSTPEGIEELKKSVSGYNKKQPVVLYCGCCPWTDCPNIGPAYKALEDMKVGNLKALYLATSFPKDWVEKGYPIEKGE